MEKKKWIGIICIGLFLGGTTVAEETVDSALNWLNPQEMTALLKNKEISFFADTPNQLELWKRSPYQSKVATLLAGRQSTLAAEGLFLVDLPTNTTVLTPTQLVRAATAFSTMKGLQVYSDSKQAMETFIFDAYRVSALNKNQRMADPAEDPPSTEGSSLVFQNEEQTGEGFSQIAYSLVPNGIEVNQTNMTGLQYGIIQLVAPYDLLTHIYVVQAGGKLVIYGIVVAKTVQFLGLEKTKIHSLYNRMKALETWFSTNLNALALASKS